MEHVASAAVRPHGHGGREHRPAGHHHLLFFMWGLLTSLNDVLIPHLKSIYTLNYVQAMLVQFCFFGAYFIVSLPAGMLIKRIGYQRGAVSGLVLAAAGCALFFPASTSGYACS
jgi:FHS family L-fucose permease-like MFS transporter